MKEMKKQMACYKSEIASIKKMESYLTLDNYQKLINEFNSLYEHYKGLKQINKKIKVELQQSNQRERTFLKLLKKTKEFGDQASRLEQEYDRLFNSDGKAIDDLIIDSADKGSPQFVETKRGNNKIPKLDFSSIFIQREVVDTAGDEEEEESDEGEYGSEGEDGDYGEESQMNSDDKKKKFES